MTSLVGSGGVTLGGIRAIGLHMHLDVTLGLSMREVCALTSLVKLTTYLLTYLCVLACLLMCAN